MTSLHTYLLADLFGFFLIAARLGGLFFFVPGFSELSVPMRVKALFVLAASLAFTPLLSEEIPPWPSQSFAFFLLIGGEFFVGYLAALSVKLIFAALDIAGSLIGYQIGIANAFASSPASAQQSALPGVVLTLTATVFVLSLDLHHALIRSFIESYDHFSPGAAGSIFTLSGDILQTGLSLVMTSFQLGLQLASPIIVTGLFLFAAAGIVNRLIPQIQVFFVTQPLQILLGLGVFFLTLPKVMHVFSEAVFESLSFFNVYIPPL